MGRALRRVQTIVPRKADAYGGKARNLAALARAGFPVPAAWGLASGVCDAFLREVLAPEDQIEALLAAPPSEAPEPRLTALAERVRRAPLSGSLLRDLQRTLDQLVRAGAQAVVVRSSSTWEDQADHSAAGIHETYLNIQDLPALADAVRGCWASLFTPRVLAYLRTVVHARHASMGLVVQAMVPADVAGVLFTVNPLTGDPGEMWVNAAWGLGSAVADGRVSPDTYRVDKISGTLRDRVVGDKALRVVPAAAGGVAEEPVPSSHRRRAALDEEALSELLRLGRRLEERFGAPQDVEWAWVQGTLYVLQSRPVSVLAPPASARRSRKRPAARDRIVWSNVNVGEALPGVATPLTWSVLSNFSELGFRRAFGALGCRVPRDAELVGSFRGRIYLNLSECTSILSQVPGLRPSTLLALGGGEGAEQLEADLERRGSAGYLLRLPVTVARFVQENYRLGQRVARFETTFEEERKRWQTMDLRILSPAGLAKTLRDAEGNLDQAGAIMLSCYGNLLASLVALRAVLRLVARGRAESLERELLSGLADVESAAPGLALWHIAEMARADPAARAILLERAPDSLRVASLPDGPTRRALQKFVRAFGHRGAREAEIAEPRWGENPTLLFATLRAHLVHGDAPERPFDMEARQRALRETALRRLDALLPAPSRAAVRHLLSVVQRFMRLRERLRGYVTEVLGMFRSVALDASRRIELREPTAGPDVAFFLTLEELHSVLTTEHSTVDVLVRRRRMQYERDRTLPDPPGTFVGYPPELAPGFTPTDALHGLAASSGQAEGPARVMHSPGDAGQLGPGEVLVAPYADVGWSPLFTVAGAIVTDLGGPLSHASIVAREYGVPSVVNVKVGTRVIRTGDWVKVDGDRGHVEILKSHPTRPAT